MFVLFFVIPALIGLLVAFLFNPINVVLNIVQIVLFVCALAFGTVAFFQGFFETSSTGYFFVAAFLWLFTVMARKPRTEASY